MWSPSCRNRGRKSTSALWTRLCELNRSVQQQMSGSGPGWSADRPMVSATALTPYTWAEKFESFERINSIRETNGNFYSSKVKISVCFTHRIYPFETFDFFCSCIRGHWCRLPRHRRHPLLGWGMKRKWPMNAGATRSKTPPRYHRDICAAIFNLT